MAARSRPTYGRFARYYDIIYHGLVNYEGDVDFLEAVFRRYRLKPRTILDLGSGTGNHDIPLARRGYRVTGLDQSSAMVSVARKKTAQSRVRVRFIRADMRSFRLVDQFDAILCMFGAFGYIMPRRDVVRVLRSVRAHLGHRGLFIFEFWQGSAARPAPFQSWVHIRKSDLQIVRLDESRYDPRTGRLPVEFRFFVFRGRHIVDRFDELHTIQTYSVPGMRALLRRGGFDLLGAFAATNAKKAFAPVTRDTFRIMAVARAK
jgi:SAM-dependent methyltransferase